MRRLMPLLTACLLVACGNKQTDTPPAPPEDPPATTPGEDEENEAPSGEASGPPANCDYIVKDECYTDKEAACAAAGCEPDKCVILESYPMQIKCG